jgi:hypothetical protein
VAYTFLFTFHILAIDPVDPNLVWMRVLYLVFGQEKEGADVLAAQARNKMRLFS